MIGNKLVLIAAGVITLLLTGCGDSTDPVRPTENPPQDTRASVIAIWPGDGAIDVATDAAISVTFSAPVDPEEVAQHFHLLGGPNMQMWMDSMDHAGGMGNMNMMQMDRMMVLMDSLQMHGSFAWNAQGDSCWFQPDSAMMPGTDHMVAWGGEMHDAMHSDGDMMGMHDSDAVIGGDRTHHFRTRP